MNKLGLGCTKLGMLGQLPPGHYTGLVETSFFTENQLADWGLFGEQEHPPKHIYWPKYPENVTLQKSVSTLILLNILTQTVTFYPFYIDWLLSLRYIKQEKSVQMKGESILVLGWPSEILYHVQGQSF